MGGKRIEYGILRKLDWRAFEGPTTPNIPVVFCIESSVLGGQFCPALFENVSLATPRWYLALSPRHGVIDALRVEDVDGDGLQEHGFSTSTGTIFTVDSSEEGGVHLVADLSDRWIQEHGRVPPPAVYLVEHSFDDSMCVTRLDPARAPRSRFVYERGEEVWSGGAPN